MQLNERYQQSTETNHIYARDRWISLRFLETASTGTNRYYLVLFGSNRVSDYEKSHVANRVTLRDFSRRF
eukprot:1381230-Amorphochlora_amoeboformis.AAC.1